MEILLNIIWCGKILDKFFISGGHVGMQIHINPEDLKKAVDFEYAELEEIIVGIKIPFCNILTIPETCKHPQIAVRNMLWDVYQPGIEDTIRIPGTPIKMHGMEDKCTRPAPLIGEHNEQILSETLGYSAEKIAELKEKGAI